MTVAAFGVVVDGGVVFVAVAVVVLVAVEKVMIFAVDTVIVAKSSA